MGEDGLEHEDAAAGPEEENERIMDEVSKLADEVGAA